MTIYICKCNDEVPCYMSEECEAAGGECYQIVKPEYAKNGVCLRPEKYPERFDREENGNTIYWVERRQDE